MPSSIKTERWEVRRSFINPGQAQRGAEQVLWVAQQKLPFGNIKDLDNMWGADRGLREITIRTEPEKREGRADLPSIFDFPDVVASVQDVLLVRDRTAKETMDSSGGFAVNIYAAKGELEDHVDNSDEDEADDTLSVVFSGIKEVKLHDPVEDLQEIVLLGVGDAIYYNNRGLPEVRPNHIVRAFGQKSTGLVD